MAPRSQRATGLEPPSIRYRGCRTSAGIVDVDKLEQWRASFLRDFKLRRDDGLGNACGRFCGVGEDLYLMDRCWNSRWTCVLAVESAPGLPIVVGQDVNVADTAKPLVPGRFLSVIGPAAALGVAARSGFADRLRRRFGNVPVLNFGRGGAGPSDFLGIAPALLEPLLAQSAAVVVVLMAGRSSGNSRYPTGVDAMVRHAEVEKLAAGDPAAARRLRNESLTTASSEYAQLAARIRNRAAAYGMRPPALFLLWFSECKLATGCWGRPSQFPQYYTDGASAPRAAAAMGATLIDASYHHLPRPYPALAVDLCQASCPPRPTGPRYKVCSLDEFRRQVDPQGMAPQDWSEGRAGGISWPAEPTKRRSSSGLGCSRDCSAVAPSYYPHDAAHVVATVALFDPIKRALEEARASDAREPDRAVGGLGGDAARSSLQLPPPLDIGRKLFYSHVHKAAGTSFIEFLRQSELLRLDSRWCAHLLAVDQVHATSLPLLYDWWHTPQPLGPRHNCTLFSLEVPKIGNLLRLMANASSARPFRTRFLLSAGGLDRLGEASHRGGSKQQQQQGYGQGHGHGQGQGQHRQQQPWQQQQRRRLSSSLSSTEAADGGLPPGEHEPQVLLLMREPGARCRSAWMYEQRLCHGLIRGAGKDTISLEYCKQFREAYGSYNDTLSHYRFAHRFCNEFVAGDLDGARLTMRGLLRSGAVKYIGITDAHYEASICLLLFQLGRFPRDACSCDGSGQKLHALVQQHDQNRARRGPGIPELRLSHADLERISPRDGEVYRDAWQEYARRVRAVEAAVGRPFLHCAASQ